MKELEEKVRRQKMIIAVGLVKELKAIIDWYEEELDQFKDENLMMNKKRPDGVETL